MKITFQSNSAIIKQVVHFDLIHTFECGQCFRWNANGDGSYTGVAGGKVLNLRQNDSCMIMSPCTERDYHNLWQRYFDLERDYGAIKTRLSRDSILEAAIGYGGGIRILRQDPWETMVSFIISANNNIPRIKGIIERLCTAFGEEIREGDKTYYTFPTPEVLAALSKEQLAGIRAGFRDGYILDAACKVAGGALDLSALAQADGEKARSMLMSIKGIGEKVANCILLFGLGHLDTVPIDVWIRRVIQSCYFDGCEIAGADIAAFCGEKFGHLGGFAQQYLFYYARQTKIV